MEAFITPRRDTHEVANQPPPLAPYNVFEADLAQAQALEREGGGWGAERLRDAGAAAGSAEAIAHSERCERNEPTLRTHDRYGHRVDEVELDPSWHWILGQAVEREIHALPWRDPRPGAHVVRAALMMTWSQVNAGVMCPVSMTYSVIPALRENPDAAAEWEPRLTAPVYSEGGALAGMAMTEKQGGSDVRANATRAEPRGDGSYELTGHKWFCSYPPCDVFLTLAQTGAGLSCFLIEGPGRNGDPGFRIQRPGLPSFLAECEPGGGAEPRLDAHLAAVRERLGSLSGSDAAQHVARRLVEDLGVALQASLLVRHAPPAVADAFCAGRLGEGGRTFGTLPAGVDSAAILERALAG